MTPQTTGRVTLFQRKRTGCNFSNFLQPRGRKPGEGRVSFSVDSHFATRLSSRDESRLPIQHHDSMERVTLFRCEHRGCNFKRTFCNQADEKKFFFFCGAPHPPSENGFRQGAIAVCRSSTTIQWDVSHFFGAKTEVAILNELFATRRFFLWRPSPSLRKRLSSRGDSRLPIQHHDSMGRVTLFRCERRGCNFFSNFF